MVSMVSMAPHPGSLPSSSPSHCGEHAVGGDRVRVCCFKSAFFSNEEAGDACLNNKAGDSQRTEGAKFELLVVATTLGTFLSPQTRTQTAKSFLWCFVFF